MTARTEVRKPPVAASKTTCKNMIATLVSKGRNVDFSEYVIKGSQNTQNWMKRSRIYIKKKPKRKSEPMMKILPCAERKEEESSTI